MYRHRARGRCSSVLKFIRSPLGIFDQKLRSCFNLLFSIEKNIIKIKDYFFPVYYYLSTLFNEV